MAATFVRNAATQSSPKTGRSGAPVRNVLTLRPHPELKVCDAEFRIKYYVYHVHNTACKYSATRIMSGLHYSQWSVRAVSRAILRRLNGLPRVAVQHRP